MIEGFLDKKILDLKKRQPKFEILQRLVNPFKSQFIVQYSKEEHKEIFGESIIITLKSILHSPITRVIDIDEDCDSISFDFTQEENASYSEYPALEITSTIDIKLVLTIKEIKVEATSL